ncbi:MAG: recombinase family protein [Candidatus Margulisiibacteriota bacterium]|nr:MAG: recombinase family protein [Candidatus Margulisiibacteriota bacterium]
MGEKVFGYVRVSTDSQAEKGYGIKTQEKAISDYCKKQGYELVQVFRDEGISGTKIDRDGLGALLSALNGVKKIVVMNTSRLWRSDTVKVLLKRELEKLHADVVSIEQPTYSIYGKDPNDFLVNGIMELLDQYDRMHICLKLARGRKTKVKDGVKGCGNAPFGYRWQHEGVSKPVIAQDMSKVQIIKDIYSEFGKTKNLNKVVQYLNCKAYLTERNRPFSRGSVQHILKNRFYIGEVRWGNTVVQGQHIPIVNKIMFGRIQVLLKSRERSKP